MTEQEHIQFNYDLYPIPQDLIQELVNYQTYLKDMIKHQVPKRKMHIISLSVLMERIFMHFTNCQNFTTADTCMALMSFSDLIVRILTVKTLESDKINEDEKYVALQEMHEYFKQSVVNNLDKVMVKKDG